MRITILLLMFMELVVGCKRTKTSSTSVGGETTTSASHASPASSATPTKTDGAAGRNWTRAEIEEVLRKDVKLNEITLTKVSGDKYTGTGRNVEGLKCTFEVRFRPGEIRVDYTHETPRGGTNHGSYHWSAEGVAKKF